MRRQRFPTPFVLIAICVFLLFLAVSQIRGFDLEAPYHGYLKTPDQSRVSNHDQNHHNIEHELPEEPKADEGTKNEEMDLQKEEQRQTEEKNSKEEHKQSDGLEESLKERERDRIRQAELREKARKQKSEKLQGIFLRLEGQEIQSIVNNPLKYSDKEKVKGHVQPYGRKIALLSASNGKTKNEREMLDLVLPNRQEYCNYHGYICTFVDLNTIDTKGDHVVWAKIGAIRRTFEEHPDVEWIWWMDTDIFLMNPEIELGEHLLSDRALVERLTYSRPIRMPDESFGGEVYVPKERAPEPEDLNLLLTQDFFGINAGSFFIRRSEWTNKLLDIWYDPVHVQKEYVFREQEALNIIIRENAYILAHTGFYPQRLFNSYTGEPNDVWTYKEGDLAIHLAGCNSKDSCQGSIDKYFPNRGRVPEKFRETGHKIKFTEGG